MEEFVLKKHNAVLRLLIAFLFITSSIIVVGNLYSIFTLNEITRQALFGLITGFSLFVVSAGYYSGTMRLMRPVITANSEGLCSQNMGWDFSVNWNELSAIEIGDRQLRLQLATSSHEKTIRLPWFLSKNGVEEFFDFIEEECKTRNITVAHQMQSKTGIQRVHAT